MGERSDKELYVILLDWEKAFDKVSQNKLFQALDRMGVDTKLQNMVKQLYKNPKYKVEVEGTHQTGTHITQGLGKDVHYHHTYSW